MESSKSPQPRQPEARSILKLNVNLGTNRSVRVIFADHQDIVRTGMRAMLEDSPVSLVGEASNGDEALKMLNEQQPDVVIIDMSLPDINGLEFARLARANHPEVKVLVVTIHEDAQCVNDIIGSGAHGYILKNADKEEILRAIKAVTASPRFFSPTVSELMIEDLIKAGTTNGKSLKGKNTLTRREQEVLHHIYQGLTSKEIANRLFLSINTVNTHRMNIMKKLDIHNTAGLVKYAVQHGLAPGTFDAAPPSLHNSSN